MVASAQHKSELTHDLLGHRLSGFACSPLLTQFPVVVAFASLFGVCGTRLAPTMLATWAAAAVAITAWRSILIRIILPVTADRSIRRRHWRQANLALISGSVVWAISLPFAAWIAPGGGPAIICVIGVVILGCVLLTHRRAPAAALFHIALTTAGLAVALWLLGVGRAGPLIAVIAVYAMSLAAAIVMQERDLLDRAARDLARRESDQTIRMLLDDHEGQSVEWQWGVDADGLMRNVSPRLAKAAGLPADMLDGQLFVSLFEPGAARDRVAAQLAEKSAFRELPMFRTSEGRRLVWRLSGHPRSDGTFMGVGRDVTDQQRIEERVRTMAWVDPLTGVASGHRFNQLLRHSLAESRDGMRRVAVLYLDLDDFRAVNQIRGHHLGDELLRELGARLKRESGERDVVARLGGDQFAILVDTPGGDGMLIERAHRLLAAAREPFHIDGQTAHISISIGIARAALEHGAGDLMRRAELALYAAKAKGRDQIAIYDDALDRRANERRTSELELREAVSREEMVLHYQPVISLQTGATVAYEALLRWRHPDRGLLMPDQFLPLAEESGLMVPLGDWVIGKALADIGGWPGAFRIAINLSPSQLRHPSLVATIDRALSASGVAPGRLELDITAGVLLDSADARTSFFEQLRALGAKIALDDFGIGQSSLANLRQTRFDRIKIDRTFICDIEASDEAQAIVSAITRLADALGIQTTAEGVERPGQLDLLRKLGCDEAQGFVILEPVEAERIEQSRARGGSLSELGAEIEDYRRARRDAGAHNHPAGE